MCDLEWFPINPVTFLGLAMPNQCCHAVTKLILGWFVDFGQEAPNLNDPYTGGLKMNTLLIMIQTTIGIFRIMSRVLQHRKHFKKQS